MEKARRVDDRNLPALQPRLLLLARSGDGGEAHPRFKNLASQNCVSCRTFPASRFANEDDLPLRPCNSKEKRRQGKDPVGGVRPSYPVPPPRMVSPVSPCRHHCPGPETLPRMLPAISRPIAQRRTRDFWMESETESAKGEAALLRGYQELSPTPRRHGGIGGALKEGHPPPILAALEADPS